MTDPRALLERYRPRLVYDAQEAYFADSAAVWTDSPTNTLRRADGSVIAKPPKLSLDFLGSYPAQRGDVIGDTTRSYAKTAEKLHAQAHYANRVYGHARRDRNDALWLQYWLFYYYNDFRILGPISGGKHEGDWELVQFELDKDDRPVRAVFSQHKEAEVQPWGKVAKHGARPVVYVARGSHANYFGPGSHWTGHWMDRADGKGPRIDPTLEQDRLIVTYEADPEATALTVANRPNGSDEPAHVTTIALTSTTGQVEIPARSADDEVWTSVVAEGRAPSQSA